MRMLRIIEFLSLDGVMQAPRGLPTKTPRADSGTAAGSGRTSTTCSGRPPPRAWAATDTYLFERKTYEAVAEFLAEATLLPDT